MKIYLLSDLHVEFHGDYPLPTLPVDAVVLAGDIDVGIGMLDVAEKYALRCGVPVVVVAGNHEYYRSDYLTLLPAFRQRAAELDNVHFLEKDSVVINNVRFLGCTLWSNFTFNGSKTVAEAKANARQCIADFHVINYGERRFTPNDAFAEFEASYQWLDEELAKPFDGDTVVVTHFLPHGAGVHPMHRSKNGGDHLTPYFTTDCSELMRKHRIATWLYGHTHNSVDVMVDCGTRLISNQRGYPREPWTYTQYDPRKIIDITATDEQHMLKQGVQQFNNLIKETGGVFTTRQAAEFLSLPQREVHQKIKASELLAYQDGRHWRLPVAQFDRVTAQPVNGLQQLLLGFTREMGAKSKVLFCLSLYETLNKTPLQLLAEGYDPNRLAHSAASYLDHGAR